MKRPVAAILALGLLAYLATGLAVVQQDELGVVRRLGAVLPEPWEPGLHWGLPWGLDRVDRIKLSQTRTLRLGASGSPDAPLARAPDPDSDDFLTGHLTLVTPHPFIHYPVPAPAP